MASLPKPLLDIDADRRMIPRSDLCLEVTLRQPGEEAIIPAAIANLSATGFLAEIPEGASLPELLDVDLPNAGRRQAQVVWFSGTMAGCNFTQPLSRADLSAARLKSNFDEPEAVKTPPPYAIGPSDPIWDMLNEATPREKWPVRHRMLAIIAAGAVPWLSFLGVAALLA